MAQDAEVLNLLRFPSAPLVPLNSKTKAKYWSRGSTVYKKPKDLNKFITLMSEEHINMIALNYQFSPHHILEADIVVQKITNQLDISPTNALWAPTRVYEPSSYKAKKIRRSYQSLEISLKWHEVFMYPTLLTSLIELQGSTDKEQVYQIMLDLILKSIPETLAGHAITGYAEIGCLDNIVRMLTGWPKTYPLLNERFSELHSILISSS